MHVGARPPAPRTVRVWDLPTRLFHWSLALCVATACASAQSGGYLAQRLHYRCGYAVLVLVLFRLAWGLAGPRYARFAQFVRGPAAVLRYVRRLAAPAPPGGAPGDPGHNPLGALSVLALLAACGLQAASGLFAKDDIASEGPLAHRVSDALVDRLTGLHDLGADTLYALVGLHLLAIALYRWRKREDLLTPMITGNKTLAADAGAAQAPEDALDRPLWPRAALLLGLSGALVCAVVNLG
jgi:cytochrome b